MSKHDLGQFSGVGTDLFIKKKSPGHHIGTGYTIEIFLNGVKQEQIYKRTKKDVIDFIDEWVKKRDDVFFEVMESFNKEPEIDSSTIEFSEVEIKNIIEELGV